MAPDTQTIVRVISGTRLLFIAALVITFFGESSDLLAQVEFPNPEAAPGAAPEAPSFGQIISQMLPMFLMVFLIFYLMIMKPQQQKQKALKDLLDSLKKGDTVTTSSGIVGRVASVEGEFVVLEVSSNVRIKFEQGHIAKRLEKPNTDKAAA